jgi:hypothetical protein
MGTDVPMTLGFNIDVTVRNLVNLVGQPYEE